MNHGSMKVQDALNNQVIVERYPFLSEMVGGLIPAVKSYLYLTEQTS